MEKVTKQKKLKVREGNGEGKGKGSGVGIEEGNVAGKREGNNR